MRVLITLERCHLRPWQPSDVRSLVRHANNREVWLNLRDLFPHPYTTADAKRWLAQVCAQEPVTTFAVVVDDSAVGGIGFRIQSDVHRLSAEIGYWLGEGPLDVTRSVEKTATSPSTKRESAWGNCVSPLAP